MILHLGHIFGLLVLYALVLYAEVPDKDAKPLTVCELVARRDEFNGRIVIVRGEVAPGAHGSWLTADPNCKYELVTRGVTWANVIHLAYPDNQSRLESLHADFRVDWRSIEAAERQAKLAAYNPIRDQITQTYIGLFMTYRNLEERVNPGRPGANKLGFGPAGLEAPAQLLIKSISDTVVKRGPQK